MIFETTLGTIGRWADSFISWHLSLGLWNFLLVPIELFIISCVYYRVWGLTLCKYP